MTICITLGLEGQTVCALIPDSDWTVWADPTNGIDHEFGREAIASFSEEDWKVEWQGRGRWESNPRRQSESTSFQSLLRVVLKRWKFGPERELVGQRKGQAVTKGCGPTVQKKRKDFRDGG